MKKVLIFATIAALFGCCFLEGGKKKKQHILYRTLGKAINENNQYKIKELLSTLGIDAMKNLNHYNKLSRLAGKIYSMKK